MTGDTEAIGNEILYKDKTPLAACDLYACSLAFYNLSAYKSLF